jgi:hypothetical protein
MNTQPVRYKTKAFEARSLAFIILIALLLVAIIASSLIAPVHATVRTAGASTGETPDITPVIEKYRAYIQKAMRQQQ